MIFLKCSTPFINQLIMKYLLGFLIIALAFSCVKNSDVNKNILLSANREASLGWVSLKIYEDKTFQFISSGFREDVIYDGTVKISNDTLYFEYEGKIPKVGKVGVIKNNFVTYIESSYVESLQIKSNNIKY